MQFCIVYRLVPKMPETIEKWFLTNYEKGMRFDTTSYQTPYFQTFPSWPDDVIPRLPMNFQCVHVKIEEKKFQILRQLIIDVESEVIPPS
jgi:hypothetical protein